MGKWHQKLQTRIQAEVENLVIEERVLGACVLVSLSAPRSPFLRLLTPEKLSLITIMEIMHLHGSGGVNDGGRAVEQEYKAQ
ncbi:hypothetical protein C8Q76DRAFT_572838, partial [Earliella scabrosa]